MLEVLRRQHATPVLWALCQGGPRQWRFGELRTSLNLSDVQLHRALTFLQEQGLARTLRAETPRPVYVATQQGFDEALVLLRLRNAANRPPPDPRTSRDVQLWLPAFRQAIGDDALQQMLTEIAQPTDADRRAQSEWAQLMPDLRVLQPLTTPEIEDTLRAIEGTFPGMMQAMA
jgi:DNA-binding HxlR family transcriptional regulator